jgi:hypothetical protein
MISARCARWWTCWLRAEARAIVGVPPLLIQTAGSLVAILALAGLARWMGLGGAPLLSDKAAVRRAAGEVADGFEVADCALTSDQTAAIARDSEGRIMVIRRHGNRFAGRILTAEAGARASGNSLDVDCGERRFGRARLEIDNAQAWADAINALGSRYDV